MNYRLILLIPLPIFLCSPPLHASLKKESFFLTISFSPLNTPTLKEALTKTPSPQQRQFPPSFQKKFSSSLPETPPTNKKLIRYASLNDLSTKQQTPQTKKKFEESSSFHSVNELTESLVEQQEPKESEQLLKKAELFEKKQRVTTYGNIIFTSSSTIKDTLNTIHEQQVGNPESPNDFIDRAVQGAAYVKKIIDKKDTYSFMESKKLLATIKAIETFLYAVSIVRRISNNGPYEVDFRLIEASTLSAFFNYYYLKRWEEQKKLALPGAPVPTIFVSEYSSTKQPNEQGLYGNFFIHHRDTKEQDIRTRLMSRFGSVSIGYDRYGNVAISLIRTGENSLTKPLSSIPFLGAYLAPKDPYPFTNNPDQPKNTGELSKAECSSISSRLTGQLSSELKKELPLEINELYQKDLRLEVEEALIAEWYNNPPMRKGAEIIIHNLELFFASCAFSNPETNKKDSASCIYTRALFGKTLKINRRIIDLARNHYWSNPTISFETDYNALLKALRNFKTTAIAAKKKITSKQLRYYLEQTVKFLNTLPLDENQNVKPSPELMGYLFDPCYQERTLIQKLCKTLLPSINSWLEKQHKLLDTFTWNKEKLDNIPETEELFYQTFQEQENEKKVKKAASKKNNFQKGISQAAILLYSPSEPSKKSPCFFIDIPTLCESLKGNGTTKTKRLATELSQKIFSKVTQAKDWVDFNNLTPFESALTQISTTWVEEKEKFFNLCETLFLEHTYSKLTETILKNTYTAIHKKYPEKQQLLLQKNRKLEQGLFCYFYKNQFTQRCIKKFAEGL